MVLLLIFLFCTYKHAFADHLRVNKISKRCNHLHLQFSFHHVEVG